MDSPPQFVVILFGALFVCLGPVLLVPGIRAYTGRWTDWVGPSTPSMSAAKHSRIAFMMFWAGLPLTVVDIHIVLDVLGMDAVTGYLLDPVLFSCSLVLLMQILYLPRFLRPVLLPRWYRDWEAAQFEVEEREAAKRRAKRTRRREKRRKAKEKARG